MAQRSPMNQRYQGDGPGGTTRKSAASAKPTSKAAESVYIKTKPSTAAEKRAAAKRREKEVAQKAAERARRAAEREKAAAAEAAAEAAEGADSGKKVATAKKTLQAVPDKKTTAVAKTTEPAKTNFLQKLIAPPPNMPNSEEYRKWRRIYWILMAIGVAAVAVGFVLNFMTQTSTQSYAFIATLIVAYPVIIGAFIIDWRKVRPLIRQHQTTGGSAAKSPKQLKHEQESRQRAEALEAARRAEKQAKRAPKRKAQGTLAPGEEAGDTPKHKKNKDTIVPGEEQ